MQFYLYFCWNGSEGGFVNSIFWAYSVFTRIFLAALMINQNVFLIIHLSFLFSLGLKYIERILKILAIQTNIDKNSSFISVKTNTLIDGGSHKEYGI